MAAKKKSKKRPTKSKRTASKKTTLRKTLKKKAAKKKKASPKKKTAKAKAGSKKKIAAKKVKAPKKQIRQRTRSVDTEAFLPDQLETRSGRQSGDLQGLSNAEGADSESVEELLDEGNAFEADVVAGVEHATNSDEREVHTREVPADD